LLIIIPNANIWFLIIITIALVLARVYLKQESATAYQTVFREVFEIAEKDIGRMVKFHHMDGTGIGCIIADAHRGQALGICQYCPSL
jgi:hypothetical protein